LVEVVELVNWNWCWFSLSPFLHYSNTPIQYVSFWWAKRRRIFDEHPSTSIQLISWSGWIGEIEIGADSPFLLFSFSPFQYMSFWGACSIPVRFSAADWAPKNLRWPVRNLQPDSSSLRLSTTRWVLDWGKWLN
jgi:hypothetical protein